MWTFGIENCENVEQRMRLCKHDEVVLDTGHPLIVGLLACYARVPHDFNKCVHRCRDACMFADFNNALQRLALVPVPILSLPSGEPCYTLKKTSRTDLSSGK